MKKLLIIILSIALAVSFATSIFLNSRLSKYSNHSIVGTYITGDSSLPGKIQYFVFTSDNEYMYYTHEKVIEDGVFEIDKGHEENRIITLHRDGGKDGIQLVHIGDSIFYPDYKGAITVFARIADVPVYSGVATDATPTD